MESRVREDALNEEAQSAQRAEMERRKRLQDKEQAPASNSEAGSVTEEEFTAKLKSLSTDSLSAESSKTPVEFGLSSDVAAFNNGLDTQSPPSPSSSTGLPTQHGAENKPSPAVVPSASASLFKSYSRSRPDHKSGTHDPKSTGDSQENAILLGDSDDEADMVRWASIFELLESDVFPNWRYSPSLFDIPCRNFIRSALPAHFWSINNLRRTRLCALINIGHFSLKIKIPASATADAENSVQHRANMGCADMASKTSLKLSEAEKEDYLDTLYAHNRVPKLIHLTARNDVKTGPVIELSDSEDVDASDDVEDEVQAEYCELRDAANLPDANGRISIGSSGTEPDAQPLFLSPHFTRIIKPHQTQESEYLAGYFHLTPFRYTITSGNVSRLPNRQNHPPELVLPLALVLGFQKRRHWTELETVDCHPAARLNVRV
ncbi:unnamed protein product [Schistocephalus solidus]|uniref:CAF1C_H4-bd domain-containing protein n=1 Tax=Schistocephalus solidus TaxID=70667 RepID=A0A183S8L8_SCHSO|nr:unnamed protein product [Schistocephalus solidus]